MSCCSVLSVVKHEMLNTSVQVYNWAGFCYFRVHNFKLNFCSLLFSQKLKCQARGSSPDIRQIDLDVNRTYRDHIMFRDRYGVK